MPVPKKSAVAAGHRGPAVAPALVGLGLLLSGGAAVFAILEVVSPHNKEETRSRPTRIDPPRPKIALPEPANAPSTSPGGKPRSPVAAPTASFPKRIDTATSEIRPRSAIPWIAARPAARAPLAAKPHKPKSQAPASPVAVLPAAPLIDTLPEPVQVPDEHERATVPAEPMDLVRPPPSLERPPANAAPGASPIVVADEALHPPETTTGAAGTPEIRVPPAVAEIAAGSVVPAPEPAASPLTVPQNQPAPGTGLPAIPPIAEAAPGLSRVPIEGEQSTIPAEPGEHAESAPLREAQPNTVAPAVPPIDIAGASPERTTGAAGRMSAPANSLPEPVPTSPAGQAGSAEPPTSAFGIVRGGEASPPSRSHRKLDQRGPSSGQFVESYPVIVLNGSEVGAVPMRMSSDNVISIYLGSFLSLFKSRMDPATFQRLSSAKAADQYVALQVLRDFGLDMEYDSKRERLMLQIR